MDRRRQLDRHSRPAFRAALGVGLAAGLLAGLLAGCSSAAAPGSQAPASVAASAPAAASAAPTRAASVAPSEAVSAAPASFAPSAAATPAGAKTYACASLMSAAEMAAATGLADAQLLPDAKLSGQPDGETYCQFLARQGAAAIALTVWTGPSLQAFDLLWNSGSSADDVSGIGDAARVRVATRTGGARVGGLGIGIVLKPTGNNGLDGVDIKAAILKILTLVAGRV